MLAYREFRGISVTKTAIFRHIVESSPPSQPSVAMADKENLRYELLESLVSHNIPAFVRFGKGVWLLSDRITPYILRLGSRSDRSPDHPEQYQLGIVSLSFQLN